MQPRFPKRKIQEASRKTYHDSEFRSTTQKPVFKNSSPRRDLNHFLRMTHIFTAWVKERERDLGKHCHDFRPEPDCRHEPRTDIRTAAHIGGFCARHLLATLVMVLALCVLWTVTYFALLIWAAVSGGGLGARRAIRSVCCSRSSAARWFPLRSFSPPPRSPSGSPSAAGCRFSPKFPSASPSSRHSACSSSASRLPLACRRHSAAVPRVSPCSSCPPASAGFVLVGRPERPAPRFVIQTPPQAVLTSCRRNTNTKPSHPFPASEKGGKNGEGRTRGKSYSCQRRITVAMVWSGSIGP